MSSTVTERPLRASEIPQMVDVDGHIDEQLLRWGDGVTVRPMFQEIPLADFEYGSAADRYEYRAADEYLPQPPSALDDWERDLHGLPARRRCACGCGLPAGLAPTGIWFVPTVEDPARPRPSEIPRSLRVDIPGAFRAALRAAADFEESSQRVRVVLSTDSTTFTEQLERAQAQLAQLTRARDSIRFDLDQWVAPRPKDLAPEVVRERALELRRTRNTGPTQQPFRHRGRRS